MAVNDALLDNSNFPLNVSLSTPAHMLDKSNDGTCNSFKQNDYHYQENQKLCKRIV